MVTVLYIPHVLQVEHLIHTGIRVTASNVAKLCAGERICLDKYFRNVLCIADLVTQLYTTCNEYFR